MNARQLGILGVLVALAGFLLVQPAPAGDEARWDARAAARYLDERAAAWSAFKSADRGEGADRVTCVSCHTSLPYALARPALRRLAEEPSASAQHDQLLDQVRKRVKHWDELDTPEFQLLYDFNETKKTQSRGTEAILNALVLARDDRERGLQAPSDSTREALRLLWLTQSVDGPAKGSWEWLNFGLGPWESAQGRYFGAALAAIAVGTAPGYLDAKNSEDRDAGLARLRGYVRDQLEEQSLHNQLWALWASTVLDGVLNASERDRVVERALAKQQRGGGWNLASLGDYKRLDDSPVDTDSDGYATGLVVSVLRRASLPTDHAGVAKGLTWLRTHQQPNGAWVGRSVNKRRDPNTHVGRFMSDAATAFAVMALDPAR